MNESRFYFHFACLFQIWIPHSYHSGSDEVRGFSFLTFGLFFFLNCSVKHVSALLKLKTNLSKADRKKATDALEVTLAQQVRDDTRLFFSTCEVKWAVSNKLSSRVSERLGVGLYSVVCLCDI